MFRIFVRILLAIALVTSIAVVVVVFLLLGFRDATSWTIVAAALAVITSIISSWGSQRVLEIQQDAQNPYPYPSIDMESRYGLIQLRVENYGGSAAHDIRLTWNKPLLNSKEVPVRFNPQEGAPDIAV